MSELPNYAQDVVAYVKARVPLLYLVSWEEERILRAVEQAAIELRQRCYVWRVTEGLRNVALPGEAPDKRAREPAAVLTRIRREEASALYVLLDFHAHLEQPLLRRQLRDLAQDLVTSNKTVLILAPRLVLPVELEKQVRVIDVQLPTHGELDAHLDQIRRKAPGRVRLDGAEREELVRSAQGMTLMELEQTLALAMVKDGTIGPGALPLVLREKEQIVRKSTALECVHWEAGFEQVGGLDLLKEFLERRKDAFSEEARRFGLPALAGCA